MPSSDVAEISDLENVFQNVVQVVFELAGIVLFITFLMAGIKWITAGGDPQKIQSARNTLTYAIGGLVVLILAYAILYIIEQLTGIEVTQFVVVQP